MEEVEFRGGSGSQAALARRMLWAAVIAGAVVAFARSGFSLALLATLVPVGIALLLVDRIVLRPRGAGQPIAVLDAQGIASPLFDSPRKRFAWDEIEGVDLRPAATGGAVLLVLRGESVRPRLQLGALDPADRERLVQLLLQRSAPATAAAAARAEAAAQPSTR